MKKTILKGGLFRKANKNSELAGELNLDNWAKRLLTYLGVAHVDPCCPEPDNIPLSLQNFEDEFLPGSRINKWDSSNSEWVPVGILDINDGIRNYDRTMLVPFYSVEPQQTLTGAGAVNVISYLTNLVSTGVAQAITLANGTTVGQVKKIKHYTDGGSMVLTPSLIDGGTTITFTTIGEYAVLIWNGIKWYAMELGNDAGTALPVLA